jgi:hypothetical protein
MPRYRLALPPSLAPCVNAPEGALRSFTVPLVPRSPLGCPTFLSEIKWRLHKKSLNYAKLCVFRVFLNVFDFLGLGIQKNTKLVQIS